MSDVSITCGSHYDELARYQIKYNFPLVRRRPNDIAIHRRVLVPKQWQIDNADRPVSDFLYDRAITDISLPSRPSFLDAGCGFGAGTRRLAMITGGSGLGISESMTQIDVARRLPTSFENGGKCRYDTKSYDVPLEAAVDFVVAVESLFHSQDLNASIRVLAACLAPVGVLIIVDDMAVAPIGQRTVAAVRAGWGAATVWRREDYYRALGLAGLRVLIDDDWSSEVITASRLATAVLTPPLQLAAIVPAARLVARFHQAQLRLHNEYRREALQYRRIVAATRRQS